MAEKDDLQNLGGDVSPPQYWFLLVLFSGSPDIVPWPRIGTAPLMLSNDTVYDNDQDILVSFTYSVSAGWWKEHRWRVNHSWFTFHLYIYTTTDLSRMKSHFSSNLFLRGPLGIIFIRKSPNKGCWYRWCSPPNFLQNHHIKKFITH